VQPAPQRLDRVLFILQLLGQLAELLDLAPVHRLEQILARRKMAVERADADAGAFCDGLQARFGAAGAEHGFGRFEHALAIAHGVGAGLSGLVGVVIHAAM